VTVAGDKAVRLALEGSGSNLKLVLKRWDLKTGQAEEPLTLREGRYVAWRVSLDGRYAFIGQPKGDGTLYSLETGGKVAQLPTAAIQSLSVLGPRVYFLTAGPLKGKPGGGQVPGRVLTAMELKTGKVVWERPVVGGMHFPPLPP
jgi:hypothetical protein